MQQITYKHQTLTFPNNWEALYNAWHNGEITNKAFIENSGLKSGTFFYLLNAYEDYLKNS